MSKSWLEENWFKVSILFIFLGGVSISLYIQLVHSKEDVILKDNKEIVDIESLKEELRVEIKKDVEEGNPKEEHISVNNFQQTQNLSDSNVLSKELLKEIMSRVVYIQCYGSNGVATGSGTIQLIDNESKVVVTNFHVSNGTGGNPVCSVKVPEKPDYTTSQSIALETERGKFSPYYPEMDVALLHIKSPENMKSSLFEPFPLPGCKDSQIEIGTQVTVLGYPSFGGNTLTVTEGTISGISPTQYGRRYKSSAKTDQGVSGGIAISEEKKCVIGIPTWVTVATRGEFLGLIQSWDSIEKYGEIF